MGIKEQCLEELVINVRQSAKLRKFEPLSDFETKIKKIARRYGGSEKIYQEGSHYSIFVKGKKVVWSPRQRGHENVLSPGVFEDTIERISDATKVPYEQLELYFKGTGKLYKRYKRRFEEEYGL